MGLNKDGQIVHRPGPWKQTNKPHKGGRNHEKKNTKGKVDVKTISHKKKHDLNRKERKNRLNQLRKAKREEVVLQKRGLGGINHPPILCMVLSLDDKIDPDYFVSSIEKCDEDVIANKNEFGHCHLSFPRLKQRFCFFVPKKHDLFSVMDGLKVADVLVLLHSTEDVDKDTEILLSVIVGHALPTTVHVLQGLDKLNPKKKSECRKFVLKNMESRFPDEKLHHADTNQDFQLLLRHIGSQKQRSVGFRDARFHLAADRISFNRPDADISTGTLKVSGYVRGQAINVNGLVHIPGWGDFQLSQIDYENDLYPLTSRVTKAKSKDEEMSLDNVVLCDKANPAQQESLQSEVVPDPMEGEQTWPTKEELLAAELCPKKSVIKVPDGVSEYQAAWIVDSEGEISDNSSDESDCEQSVSHMSGDMDYDMDDLESAADINDENYDKELDMDEEKQMLVKFKEERMNKMFPDEQDTPVDTPARIRFQRYRGLKNFNSSPWDPMENLPPDYARIYRFANFRQTKKKVLTSEKEGAMPGLYVTLHIKNVPQSLYDSMEESQQLVIYGLLPHEQKMSVVNVVIRKHSSCKTPIKSKDSLIFHIGFRRFTCKPIFSEHKTGNKYKYERFLPSDTAVVASFYAPVVFPPASVIVFKQSQNGSHELVATGSILNVDPNRIVVKRLVLSGHPFRVYKRSALVRYMFFNKEDINWFKPIELRTKCGRRGHIRESLGTHGHMKCVFDKQLQSQDVVLMTLFKRVFPKWTFDPYVSTPVNHSPNGNSALML